MASRILSWVDSFPEEASCITKLVAGYGELEFDAFQCAGLALNNSDLAFKLLFRLRSESQRIDTADALIFPTVRELKIEGQYSQIIGSLRQCRNIRNTYAHCHWLATDDTITYFNFEDAAKKNDDDGIVVTTFVSLPLLKSQVAYFEYCSSNFLWLYGEICQRRGGLKNPRQLPKPLPKPDPDNPPS